MSIRKAVITAAAPRQRDLPLQTLVDHDGQRKSVLCLQVDELARAGIESVCVVVGPQTESAYRAALGESSVSVIFAVQETPRGYGHALWCARDFVQGEMFLHQVGDHLFLPDREAGSVAAQIARVAVEAGCSVSGVQATRESLLTSFGTIGAQRVRGTQDRYSVETVVEKPTPTQAEQTLLVPGLRLGYYLCFTGTHALSPLVLSLLDNKVQTAQEHERVELSPVLNDLASREKYLAVETRGRRCHLDTRYGLLTAQLDLALSGPDRDSVLVLLTDLLAAQKMA